jgi:hypothetical protein
MKSVLLMRSLYIVALFLLATAADPATLQKLGLDEMTQKSTAIVRGRVQSCAGEFRGSIIYTHCKVAVSETWKGLVGSQADVATFGGTSRGAVQNFSGAPTLRTGEEYVLFLWTGKSGLTQVIGLSQGIFEIKAEGSAASSKASNQEAVAERPASSEVMLDASGTPVQDNSVRMKVSDLKVRVQRAQSGKAQ